MLLAGIFLCIVIGRRKEVRKMKKFQVHGLDKNGDAFTVEIIARNRHEAKEKFFNSYPGAVYYGQEWE